MYGRGLIAVPSCGPDPAAPDDLDDTQPAQALGVILEQPVEQPLTVRFLRVLLEVDKQVDGTTRLVVAVHHSVTGVAGALGAVAVAAGRLQQLRELPGAGPRLGMTGEGSSTAEPFRVRTELGPRQIHTGVGRHSAAHHHRGTCGQDQGDSSRCGTPLPERGSRGTRRRERLPRCGAQRDRANRLPVDLTALLRVSWVLAHGDAGKPSRPAPPDLEHGTPSLTGSVEPVLSQAVGVRADGVRHVCLPTDRPGTGSRGTVVAVRLGVRQARGQDPDTGCRSSTVTGSVISLTADASEDDWAHFGADLKRLRLEHGSRTPWRAATSRSCRWAR